MNDTACRHAEMCNEEGTCANGCEERKVFHPPYKCGPVCSDALCAERCPFHSPARSEAAPSAALGLVERLRNGGQTDLADMAEGLLSALELLIGLNMDQDDTTLAAIESANDAIAAATGEQR